MGRLELSGATTACYICGEPGLTMPSFRTLAFAQLVVTDTGTAYRHMKDHHGDEFARLVTMQQMINRRQPDKPPRKVDGSFLLPGQDPGDIQ